MCVLVFVVIASRFFWSPIIATMLVMVAHDPSRVSSRSLYVFLDYGDDYDCDL